MEYGGQPLPPPAGKLKEGSKESFPPAGKLTGGVKDHGRSHGKPEKENEVVPCGLGHCWVLTLAGSQPNWSRLECDSSWGPESQDSTCCPLTKGPSPSVQVRYSVASDSLRPHGLQHARLLCPSPTHEACSNSCLLSW